MTLEQYSDQIKAAKEARTLRRAEIEAECTRWWWRWWHGFRATRSRNESDYYRRCVTLWRAYANANPNEAAADGGRVPAAATLPIDAPIPQTFVKIYKSRGLAQFATDDMVERPEPQNTLLPEHAMIAAEGEPKKVFEIPQVDEARLRHAELFLQGGVDAQQTQRKITAGEDGSGDGCGGDGGTTKAG